MDLFSATTQLIIMAGLSIIIMKACGCFEQAADYIGRNMGAGARGSLIDAIGSSLPELLVTLMFLFSGKPEMMLAGISVSAGSAIFNTCLIPALSIFAAKDTDGNKVSGFKLSKKTLARDGFWLLAVEGLLVWFLGHSNFTLLMGGTLLVTYVLYVLHVIRDSKKAGNDKPDAYEYESLKSKNVFYAIFNYDFNKLLFNDKPFTTARSWIVLSCSVAVVSIACHFLTNSLVSFSSAVAIPIYFSAVILGAAVTSIPDAILSIKSSQRGSGTDAVGNVVGSNIFDIAISFGLPITLYLLVEGGSLPLAQDHQLLMLRIFVWGSSAAVVAALYLTSQNVSKKTAWFLLAIYAVWLGYICSIM